MADERKREHNREVLKLCFEYFKHFTTISTAAALIELTLYQLFELTSRVAVGGLIVSGITVILSIAGMSSLSVGAALEEDEFPEVGGRIIALMFFTALSFVAGLLVFADVAVLHSPGPLPKGSVGEEGRSQGLCSLYMYVYLERKEGSSRRPSR